YIVRRYRPRIENLFARIEKWENAASGETHWRIISKDNIRTYFGLTPESRITDPADKTKVFEWLVSRTHDDKGNISVYKYKTEDFAQIDKKLNEKNRLGNSSQVYLKKILYANRQPYYL